MFWGALQRAFANLLCRISAIGVTRTEAPMTPEELMTPEEFTRDYVAKFRVFHPGAEVTIVSALLVDVGSNFPDVQVFRVNLDNVFRECLGEPANASEMIDRHIRTVAGNLAKAPEFERHKLIPVVRHKELVSNEPAGSGEFPFAYPLAGELYVVYVADTPDVIIYPNESRLSELGLEESQIRALALENLRHIASGLTIVTYPAFASVSSTDAYLTSVLLIDGFWTTKQFSFRGDIVVFVVARDLMLVTGSQENEGLERVMKMAHDMIDKVPYSISSEPIVRRDGRWHSFVQ